MTVFVLGAFFLSIAIAVLFLIFIVDVRYKFIPIAFIIVVALRAHLIPYIKLDFTKSLFVIRNETYRSSNDDIVDLSNVKDVKLETLDKNTALANDQEQIKKFSRYLVFEMKDTNTRRYVHVSLFTKKQVNSILVSLTKYLDQQKNPA
jgi:hypothetical protein